MARYLAVSALLITMSWLSGCSRTKPPETEPTFPVTGIVHIDGKPTPFVRVYMFPANDPNAFLDPNLGAPHQGITDSEGKFQITTYYAGDGAPVGEYVLCFYWQGNPRVEPFAIPDELPVDPAAAAFNRRYGNPTRSTFKVKVEEGKTTDLGVLELKTK